MASMAKPELRPRDQWDALGQCSGPSALLLRRMSTCALPTTEPQTPGGGSWAYQPDSGSRLVRVPS